MFPVMLSLRGRRCLVVGGGGVALRKIEALRAEEAAVTVVTPEAVPGIEELARSGAVELQRRRYAAGEAAGFALVFAATGDRGVNRRIFEDGENAGVLVNVVDDPELCRFHMPARIRRGSLQLTVSSAGEAPFAVRRLRQLLERRLGHEWSQWLDAAARFRSRVRERGLEARDESALFDRFVDETVDAERLRARVPLHGEIEEWLDAPVPGRTAAPPAPRAAGAPPRAAVAAGLVSLVGAGPGDPGLLTRRGHRRLMTADTVVYDRLAEPALPGELPERVELYCVGKTAGHHPIPQEEINALLVRLALEGKRVVRLKGGDPYVFGRGGEEAEALRAAGVPFEVVPGVTSGVAVPAYAGIPVTHRGEAVRVTFLTAHECAKSSGPQVRWDLLAQDASATIVGYMGLTTLPSVAGRLIAAGMDPETPGAVIERGTTSAQRRALAPLRDLAREARRVGIRPPALFVIGPTAARATELDWFASRPLAGQRLLVPPPAGALAESLDLAGAEVVEAALPLSPAGRVTVGALPLTGCVMRCPEEVDLADEERDGCGWEDTMVAWCVGRATAERARRLGWRHVEELADAGELVGRMARRTREGFAA